LTRQFSSLLELFCLHEFLFSAHGVPPLIPFRNPSPLRCDPNLDFFSQDTVYTYAPPGPFPRVSSITPLTRFFFSLALPIFVSRLSAPDYFPLGVFFFFFSHLSPMLIFSVSVRTPCRTRKLLEIPLAFSSLPFQFLVLTTSFCSLPSLRLTPLFDAVFTVPPKPPISHPSCLFCRLVGLPPCDFPSFVAFFF